MINSGCVYLVGAGPGDPKMLTLRAAELLAIADVVAYDELVSPDVLAMIHPGAERLAVGRRHGAGETSFRLHPLALQRAQAGLQVVRLKCGDPLIFGRGGEEAQELREAGIAFEIVPGVSAAVGAAAHAGIPLTHRDYASDVTFITGHDVDGSHRSLSNWAHVAQQGGTLVLFMVSRRLHDNLQRLIRLGRPAHTPAAYVAGATTGHQEVVVGTLQNLAERVRVRQLDVRKPALVIVGEVVRLHDELGWRTPKPVIMAAHTAHVEI